MHVIQSYSECHIKYMMCSSSYFIKSYLSFITLKLLNILIEIHLLHSFKTKKRIELIEAEKDSHCDVLACSVIKHLDPQTPDPGCLSVLSPQSLISLLVSIVWISMLPGCPGPASYQVPALSVHLATTDLDRAEKQ